VAYTYHAYGLSFTSSTAIPPCFPRILTNDCSHEKCADILLTVDTEPPDWVRSARQLESSIRHVAAGYSETPTYTVTAFGGGELLELAYCDGATFAVNRDASQLWAMCLPPLTLDDLAIYLQGPVMGFVLRQRGITALHASAVAINGHAAILCGPTEAGKSTTAAALGLQGIPILCDDITAVRELNGHFFAEPGHTRVCLWPETVRDLLGCSSALPRLKTTWEKCFLALDGARARFEPRQQELGVVYILANRDTSGDIPRIEELNNREALLALLRNTYMNWLLDRDQRAAEFDALSKIVLHVPVRKIIPHRDPRRLRTLCDLIVRDVELR
jgi:hypothetical protein